MTSGTDRDDWQVYTRLLGYLRPLWFFFLIAMAGFFLGSAATVGFAELLDHTIDAIDSGEPSMRLILPAAMVLLVLSRAVGAFLGSYFLARVSSSIVHRLRCQLFDQLLVLPSEFYDRTSQGHLVSRITFNVSQVTGALTEALRVVAREGSLVLGLMGYLVFKNWKLALVFFVVAPFIGWIVSHAGRRFRRISQRIQTSMGDVTHVASETVQGYRVVRTFGGEAYERDRFKRASDYNRRQQLKMTATSATSAQVIQVLVAGALAMLVWMIMDPVFLADMDAGAAVAFITAAGLLAKPIKQLSDVNATIQKGLAAAQDIFSQFDEQPEADDGGHRSERLRGELEFRDVTFRYPGSDDDVLHELSFTVEPGQTVALVGRSGAGKSTLVSLIPRFYRATSGEILLDGVPLSGYSLSGLREQIAIVTQQITLFNDSIARNIAYGSLAASSRDEIVEAAKRADAWEFIDALPQGLETLVGDNGIRLSGGQRQRVALARAILKDAPILILDEATSALDNETERHIQEAMSEVMEGRTTLVVAHRLSTVERADVIIVLDGGRIVESGRHAELLERDGVYAQLYRSEFDRAKRSRRDVATLPMARSMLQGRMPVERTFNPLVNAWYGGALWPRLLTPIAWLFRLFVTARRRAYVTGRRSSWRAPVPVIVIGNIVVGGSGKTPLVIWLVEWLQRMGLEPGIVSRGYGGRSSQYPLLVDPGTPSRLAGDEAPMVQARTGVPVVVDPDRVQAAQWLLTQSGCDVIVADDGLQHYALGRDVEIIMVDGARGLGNGRCLPAGPLREPAKRLEEADLLVSTGEPMHLGKHRVEHVMSLEPSCFVNMLTGERVSFDAFRHIRVHGIAGIGNPARFFHTLGELGLEVLAHGFPDHHPFVAEDLRFDGGLPVVMTEKDAVRCRELDPNELPEGCWYLEVDATLDEVFQKELTRVLQAKAGLLPVQPSQQLAPVDAV